ncbi:hypothetical protein [Roseibium aggregatum]|uniref:hypothetical protein n=1 Tax=Roseibium aggregatum TaxID=187304 RepID=UPI001E40EA27|nr:hypothetical protein [Roseibium aggregatum]UES36692.1 hypothetical protein GFC08_01815 [Roseibium aggregatum]
MSIQTELRRAFELASLKNEAKSILTPREWKTYQEIVRVHEKQRLHEERAYKTEIKTRVEIARRRVISEAGQKNKDLKPRFVGRDSLNKDDINRQAVRDVQHAHHRRLAAIDKMQAREIKRLIDACEHAHAKSRQLHEDFSRSADRRSGNERRKQNGLEHPNLNRTRTRSLRRQP